MKYKVEQMNKANNYPTDTEGRLLHEKAVSQLLSKGYSEPFTIFIPETGLRYYGPLKECMDYFVAFIQSSKHQLCKCQLDTSINFSGMAAATRIFFDLQYNNEKGYSVPELMVRTTGFKMDYARKVGAVELIPSLVQIRDLVWTQKAAKNKTKAMRK